MKIGILETGRPPEPLRAAYGDYPGMFQNLLGPGFDYVTYPVEQLILPADPAECDAYVVTGSPAGVYEDLPWIEPLKRFLVEARERRPGRRLFRPPGHGGGLRRAGGQVGQGLGHRSAHL